MSELLTIFLRSKSLPLKLSVLLSIFAKVNQFAGKNIEEEISILVKNGWKQDVPTIAFPTRRNLILSFGNSRAATCVTGTIRGTPNA